MAWYRLHYHCGDCGTDWEDEWSSSCDDECPECCSRDWSPYAINDLTFLIEPEGVGFAVLKSSPSADHKPRNARVALEASIMAAEVFIASSSNEIIK